VKAIKTLPAGEETLPEKEALFSNGANRFRIADSIGILQMRSFAKSDASFLDRTFEYLRLHKIKGLILDLRNNTGGNRNAAVQLTTALVSGPFSYAILQPKNLHPKKYLTPKGKRLYLLSKLKYNVGDFFKGHKTPLGRQFVYSYNGSKTPFAGKLVVLTNGFTSSSATMVTSWLKQYRPVTFMGSQAGGGYNGNSGGSFPTIRLPHSGVEINFPIYRLILDAASAQYSGIEPDEGWTNLLEDAKSGVDGVLEEALEQLRKE
jgi:C-terminal processing protease CtpA/Prc